MLFQEMPKRQRGLFRTMRLLLVIQGGTPGRVLSVNPDLQSLIESATDLDETGDQASKRCSGCIA